MKSLHASNQPFLSRYHHPTPPPPRPPLAKQHFANERPSFYFTYLKSTNIKGEPLFNFSKHKQQRRITGSLSIDDGDAYI